MIFSQKFLVKHELFFRRIYAVKYLGHKCRCNICDKSFSHFILIGAKEKICPRCGSLSRNRRMFFFINELSVKGKVLDFSPSRSLFRRFSKEFKDDYVSTDFANEFIASKKYDITNIPEPDETFDCIICYHILEHVINDVKAMHELFRILKRNGLALIQTPFKEGEIFEDLTITDENIREKLYGQKDHVRLYSVNGLKNRLEECGFKITIKNFPATEGTDVQYGLQNDETVLIAYKL